MLLNNQQITEEIKVGVNKMQRPMGEKHNDPKSMECRKSNSKREVYSNTILSKKQEKHQIDNLTLHLKQLEKIRTKNSQYQKKERNHKDHSRNK